MALHRTRSAAGGRPKIFEPAVDAGDVVARFLQDRLGLADTLGWPMTSATSDHQRPAGSGTLSGTYRKAQTSLREMMSFRRKT